MDGGVGFAEEIRCLLDGAAEEVSQFDDLKPGGVNDFQLVESDVELQDVRAPHFDPGDIRTKWNVLDAASATLGLIFAGVVDQDKPHDLSGEGKEVRAIRKHGAILVDEAEVKLMDQ